MREESEREESNRESPGESNTEQYRAIQSKRVGHQSRSELDRRASRRERSMRLSRCRCGYLDIKRAQEISADVAGEGRGEGSR